MKKKELIEENDKLKDDIKRHEAWWVEIKEYSDRMIKATWGEMPIVTDPVNNIQYLEIVSMDTAEKIKTILHQNKVLKILGFIEFLVIIILILFILGM